MGCGSGCDCRTVCWLQTLLAHVLVGWASGLLKKYLYLSSINETRGTCGPVGPAGARTVELSPWHGCNEACTLSSAACLQGSQGGVEFQHPPH